MKASVAVTLACQVQRSSFLPSFSIDQADRLVDPVQQQQQTELELESSSFYRDVSMALILGSRSIQAMVIIPYRPQGIPSFYLTPLIASDNSGSSSWLYFARLKFVAPSN